MRIPNSQYAYSPSAICQLIIVTIKPVPVSQAKNPPYPLEAAWKDYVSGGVTLLSISNTKHKERPLRRRIWDKMRVLRLHLIFTLPGELRTSPGVPTHFDNRNTNLLQTLDLMVHDLDRFLDEVQFVVNLDFIQCLDTDLDLNYFLGCLVDDLWANELSISNLNPADR
nr:hypothetical protein [Tanacetum cinerariifolium]